MSIARGDSELSRVPTELWLRLSSVGDVAYVKKPLIRVRARDSSNRFFYSNHRLVSQALAAKRMYLEWEEDESRREYIRRHWRKLADRSAFSALLRALNGKADAEIPAIAGFMVARSLYRASPLSSAPHSNHR